MLSDRSRDALDRLLRHPLARALVDAARPRRVWLVGGAVRDALLGDPSARDRMPDLDAVVDDGAGLVADRLARELPARRVRLGGDRFAAERLIAAAGTLDLWDLAGGTLDQDLARRDFTVNALALDPSGRLVDPRGGLEDLTARRLRANRPSVFEEDPVRVLRLARFAVTLNGFRVVPRTARSARSSAPALRDAAGERIREELARTWGGARLARGFRALVQVGAWPRLWLDGEGGRPAVAARTCVAAAARADAALDAAPGSRVATTAAVALGHALAARLAVGQDDVRASLERLARRAVLSRDELRAALTLTAQAAEEPPRDDASLRWFLHRAGRIGRQALALAAAAANAPRRPAWAHAARRGRELLELDEARILEPEPILSGDEIAAGLGIRPGPELGRAVRRLRELQVRGEVSDRAQALARLADRRG